MYVFTVPFISAIGIDAISWVGNLFLVMKTESKRQSEEPKSTRPSKTDWTSGKQRKVYSTFGTDVREQSRVSLSKSNKLVSTRGSISVCIALWSSKYIQV